MLSPFKSKSFDDFLFIAPLPDKIPIDIHVSYQRTRPQGSVPVKVDWHVML